MAQLIVRNLEEEVRSKLRERAQQHGRSMEEEVREILRSAVAAPANESSGLGNRISERFARYGFDKPVQELRGTVVQPPALDE